jgi:hypothetical protein
MRLLFLLVLLVPLKCFAGEFFLTNEKIYVVPENKIWLVKNTKPAECKVCTADIYIKGQVSNVEVNGVIFSGEFNFSFGSKNHTEVKLYAGTEISLGDTRPELLVYEVQN